MNDFFVNYISNILPISFCIKENGKETKVGSGKPEFNVFINKPLNKKEFLKSTSLALAEAYIDKTITTDGDLYYILDTLLSNIKLFKSHKHFKFSTSQKAQKKQVTSHYDLGNDFYSLWLDETMTYSCAYFKNKDDSLKDAQINKIHHILDKLYIEPGMKILDIGCGWGQLLIEAAKKYDISGVGITLSKEQHKKGMEKIKELGLMGRIELKIMDYRDLEKSGLCFDRIVSVGMLEHVGRGKYEEFFKNANAVLKDSGLFLLHFISGQKESKGDAFISKYVFPGGIIPSLREIISIMPDFNFQTLDIENLRRHYNKTLLCWYDNFCKCKSQVVEMKGESFTRMWEIYLLSCAAAFNNAIVDVHQILMSKGTNNNLPLIRTV